MIVRELREALAALDDHLEVVIPMTRDGDYEEETVGGVLKRESMFGGDTVVVIVSDKDL